MAGAHLASVVRFIRGMASRAGGGETSDGELLRRFAGGHDEAAFNALLQRHGTMVLGVCRRVLGDTHDAEDAFQATFLVLARKARSVRQARSVSSWLYGVAYRTALKARAQAARRRALEAQAVAARTEAVDPSDAAVWRDLRPVLDEEVSRLPERYRLPFVLCYLEGRTNAEAAQVLGCPVGTVLSRLAWARERLRGRLTRRGVTLSAGALAAGLSQGAAEAAPPPALAGLTLKAAMGFAAGNAAAAGVSAEVAALTEGVLRAMFMTKLRVLAGVLLTATVLAAGAGFLLGGTQEAGADAREGRAAGSAEGPLTEATASEVARVYRVNDALADEKFTGKVVRVTGTVQRVRRVPASGEKDTYWLLLSPAPGAVGGFAGGGGPGGGGGIGGFGGGAGLGGGGGGLGGGRGGGPGGGLGGGFGPGGFRLSAERPLPLAFLFGGKEARKRLAALEPGQRVTVEGRCDGVRMPLDQEEAVQFRECRLVHVEKRGPVGNTGGVGN
jgi:RNA polymerase sigma factor (sigma-70 family)